MDTASSTQGDSVRRAAALKVAPPKHRPRLSEQNRLVAMFERKHGNLALAATAASPADADPLDFLPSLRGPAARPVEQLLAVKARTNDVASQCVMSQAHFAVCELVLDQPPGPVITTEHAMDKQHLWRQLDYRLLDNQVEETHARRTLEQHRDDFVAFARQLFKHAAPKGQRVAEVQTLVPTGPGTVAHAVAEAETLRLEVVALQERLDTQTALAARAVSETIAAPTNRAKEALSRMDNPLADLLFERLFQEAALNEDRQRQLLWDWEREASSCERLARCCIGLFIQPQCFQQSCVFDVGCRVTLKPKCRRIVFTRLAPQLAAQRQPGQREQKGRVIRPRSLPTLCLE